MKIHGEMALHRGHQKAYPLPHDQELRGTEFLQLRGAVDDGEIVCRKRGRVESQPPWRTAVPLPARKNSPKISKKYKNDSTRMFYEIEGLRG